MIFRNFFMLVGLLLLLSDSLFQMKTEAQEFSDCDPLVPKHCLLPFPNNFWLRNSSSTISGKIVHFGSKTLPVTMPSLERISALEYNKLDGFPIIPSMNAYFENVDISDAGIPHLWNEAVSLQPNCKTIVMRADTLELIPHFAELDHTSDVTEERAFMVWPLRALEFNTRYIVAMRNLVNTKGELIEPSTAFKALRDGISTQDYDIEGRRAVYEDIFMLLSKINVTRSELTLAWEFNTVSKEATTQKLLFMRNDATSRLPNDGPDYTITEVVDNFSDNIQRRIKGTYQSPLYMTSDQPGAYLVENSTGMPVFQSFTPIPFTVLIPKSVANGTFESGRIIQYGHGLFKNQTEVEQEYLTSEANRFGWVMGAVDWWGISQADELPVIEMLAANFSNFRIVPDRLKQGMTNALMMMKLMRGKFSKDANFIFNGKNVMDITRFNYLGNSAGGIMGTLYMALSQDVTHGVVGVPGTPFSLILPRSADFVDLFDIFKLRLSTSIDRIMMMSIFQMQWDSSEPAGFVTSITSNNLPDTPKKTIVVHYGLADAQVTYLSAYTLGRSVGADMFINNVRENNETLFGFNYISGPSTTAMIQGFDFGMPAVPMTNTPPSKKYDTHELTRRDPRAQAQIDHFFNANSVVDYCGGMGCQPMNITNLYMYKEVAKIDTLIL